MPVDVLSLAMARSYVKERARLARRAERSKEELEIWKDLKNVQAVIVEAYPIGFPANWVVMNAPRPLHGDKVIENGEFVHGRYYAGIEPNIEFAKQLVLKSSPP